MQNRIDAVLPAEINNRNLDKIREIRDSLPFLVDLTADERRELPRMGDKSRAFVQQALAIAEQDDSFLPRSFDVTEMRKDWELFEALSQFVIALNVLKEKSDDTLISVSSDLYVAALEIYQALKRNGQGASLDGMTDALAKRFARRVKKEDGAKEPAQ